jgi:hypothetical protein
LPPTDDAHFTTNENFLTTKRPGDDLQVSRVLMQTPIKPLVQNAKDVSTVWQFLARNQSGAMYELVGEDDESRRRYVTLNQINLSVGPNGSKKEKMLIVRDVSDLQELTVYAKQKVSYGMLQEMLVDELVRKVGELTQRVEFGGSSKNLRSMATELSMVGRSI